MNVMILQRIFYFISVEALNCSFNINVIVNVHFLKSNDTTYLTIL